MKRVAAVTIALLASLPVAAARAAAVHVDVTHGSVTVSGTKAGEQSASPQEAIAAITAASQVDIRGTPIRIEPLQLPFHAESVEDAIKFVLGKQSYLARYASDGSLRRIDILTPASASPPNASAEPATAQTTPQRTDMVELPDRERDVRGSLHVDRRLREILGTDSASSEAVLQVAIGDADPTVRADALRAVARSVTGPDQSRNLLETLQQFDDDGLVAALTSLAGDQAENVLRTAARHTEDRELRSRLMQLRRNLVEQ